MWLAVVLVEVYQCLCVSCGTNCLSEHSPLTNDGIVLFFYGIEPLDRSIYLPILHVCIFVWYHRVDEQNVNRTFAKWQRTLYAGVNLLVAILKIQ